MTAQEQKEIESLYAKKGANQELDISEEKVELICGDLIVKGKAMVKFDFIPGQIRHITHLTLSCHPEVRINSNEDFQFPQLQWMILQ
jgi:hypothetical protein